MRNKSLYTVVGILTVGHLAVRALSGGAAEAAPVTVSPLVPGDRVEAPRLHSLLAWEEGDDPEACRLVVAFDPDCPFCAKAARAEAGHERAGPTGETLWVTFEEGPRLGSFAELLSPRVRQVVAPEVYQALRVTAVPAAFLVRASGELRWVGPYQGTESAATLEERCNSGGLP